MFRRQITAAAEIRLPDGDDAICVELVHSEVQFDDPAASRGIPFFATLEPDNQTASLNILDVLVTKTQLRAVIAG